MAGVREFFETGKGRVVAGAFLLLAVGIAAYTVLYGGGNAAAEASDRMFVDATTGKPYEYVIKVGDKFPVKSPSGNSGYPAEACYWTKDGKPKTTPTYVLLNTLIGKAEPTFCPDCGRLVVAHNPVADPTLHAPPTKDEYALRRTTRPAAEVAESVDAERGGR